MSGNRIRILGSQETLFFSHLESQLGQWIMLTVESRLDRPTSGRATIAVGDRSMTTPLEIVPGVREYRCYAPVLWPDHPPVEQAAAKLVAGEYSVQATTPAGHHRPWTVYLLSDVCTDYTWVYASEEECLDDDAALTEAELALAEGDAPDNHYNLVHAREIEFYLRRYPERAERLFEHLRRGTITLNPFYNMCLTGAMSLEELIRQFYPARRWALEHGLDLSYANHQETPTLTWAMASILADCGITHLVKSILPYECPWVKRLEEPPVFIWEGPDGGRTLVRRRNEDYVEGRFVLRSLRATVTALHDEILPRYEKLGETYPYSAIGLVGCYGDLSPSSPTLPSKKAATIAAYNAQGWEYPKLVNASHKQFWDDLDAQIAARRVQVPVYRGHYGTAWDAWPTCLAHDYAAWRRAQERALTADKLAAILSRLDPAWYEAHRAQLAEGWTNALSLADHAWNGDNEANIALNAALRRRWQTAANRAFDGVIESGLQALGRQVTTGVGQHVLVFNALGWTRSGLVRVADAPPDSRVVDVATGQAMPSQAAYKDGKAALAFEARELPSLGYRLYALERGAQVAEAPVRIGSPAPNTLESPFYRVELSPITGGIVSLYDKVRGQELADASSPYHINQCLYLSNGIEHTPSHASIKLGVCGPLYGQIVAHAELKNTRLVSTITLYAHLDRVDITNELHKLATSEKQELDFAFPLRVPGRQIRIEAPGVIIAPEAEYRPGAGQAVTAIRHFVDLFNEEHGVTFAQADCGCVEFGHRTTAEDPLAPDASNSTLLSLALENDIDWHEAVRDQGGVTHFVFRYSLRGHGGGFDPVAAVHFGWEDNNELLAVSVAEGQVGRLPSTHSFAQAQPDHVILTNLKMGEEGGLVVRLWECAGDQTSASVCVNGLGALQAAFQTDHLERGGVPLPTAEDEITLPLRGRGLGTVRLRFV